MTVRVCSHRLSMQSDVLNDPQQQQLSNEPDCSSSLPTTLIYSGLKLHPKPLLPTISMTSPMSFVKKLTLPDTHPDNPTKNVGSAIRHSSTSSTPSSIRLVTPTTGKSSPPTALQFQFLDKSSLASSPTTTNGGFATSKTYILNHQQTNSTGNASAPLVTLIPPGTTAPKIQTLISSSNDTANMTDCKQASFLSKNRVTLVQPLITNSLSSSSSVTNSGPQKLVIQPNSSSSIWSQQPQTKFLSAKVLARPVHLISSNEHSALSSPTSNENPIFTTKNLDSGHQAFIHMSLLPSNSTSDSINSVQLTNFYSTPSSVRISTTQQRPMDHNNNHQTITTPIIREMHTEEKLHDSPIIKNIHHNKNAFRSRTRLPLQPSPQQTSSILPTTSKKHKLPEDEPVSLAEPPTKMAHYEQFDSSIDGKKNRKSHHRSLAKISLENATPSNPSPLTPVSLTSSSNVESTEIVPSKKRSSAEIAAAAILSSNHMRKKRVQRKNSEELLSNHIKQESTISTNDPLPTDAINDELLKRLSQDFVYLDKRTGIRWISTKTRSQPMSTLLSRVSWKPKINHYEKYSDIIRTNPKRTVPVRNLDTVRKKLTQPGASWRIDRLTTYLHDLTQDERATQNTLSDIAQSLDQLNINDHSVQNAIGDLVEGNIQRHRYFCEHLTQISTLLVNLLDHGNTLQEICSTPKFSSTSSITNSSSTITRRTKER